MKRRNNLYEDIASYGNIRLAFLKALRGKRASAEILLFCRDVNASLDKIRTRLLSEHIRWGEYHQFTIMDPKKRVISAAPFADRIIHHAVMNVLEPLFERQMVYRNYACRAGKGMHAAVRYAFSKCKAATWFLKLDIRKYFDSVDHGVLKDCLRRIVKDKKVLGLLDGVIDSYETSPGTGIPIGNLTSQFFANLYLSRLDHYILEQLKPSGYARYMDDFVLWGKSQHELRQALGHIRMFCSEELQLGLKQALLGKTGRGLPFLGFLVKKDGIYLLGKSKRRMVRRAGEIGGELERGKITEEKAAARITSVCAAVLLARTHVFRVRLWHGSRKQTKFAGREPGDPGRWLERCCVRLRGVRLGRRRPWRPGSYSGVPCCVPLSPA
jgi:retron-type reverse transcriptase